MFGKVLASGIATEAKLQGKNQVQTAASLKMSPGTWNQFLNGKRQWGTRSLRRVCQVYPNLQYLVLAYIVTE